MRIWAFPSFYPYDVPGLKWSGIFAHRQFKGLIENGADLKVIQPILWTPPAPFNKLNKSWEDNSKVIYPMEREYDGIHVYHPRIGNMRPGFIFRKKYEQRYIESITNFFERNNIQLNPKEDIFYSQWMPTARLVQTAAQKLGIKSGILLIGDDVLVWPHDNARTMSIFIESWESADIRFAVAGYLAEEANKLVGKNLSYSVVRRGVEYQNFEPVSAEKKTALRSSFNLPPLGTKNVILSVGSALVRKGWLDLFDALKDLREFRDDFILLSINSGSSDIDLDAEARKRGLSEHFKNLKEIPPADIAKYYVCADIFCLPSHWEGIANAVVEALSCGIPVLTTNVCGHPELIQDGYNGLLVPPKQPKLIFEKLKWLLENPEKRNELAQNAREFIVNKWGSFKDNSAKLYKILEANLEK